MENVVLKNVRASFVRVFTPQSFNGQDPKYSLQVIMPKDHKDLKKLEQAVLEAAREKWPNKAKGTTFPGTLKNPLRDGDVEREDRPEYKGSLFFNASSKRRPVVLNSDKTPLEESDNVLYSGCFVNVSVNAYTFDVSGNKGVALGLNGVQFHRKGDSLGGPTHDATEDFDVEELDVDDDDDLI